MVFSAGVAMYMWVEGWNLLDSFYMVVVTLSTVGYMEVNPLSPQGRLLTSFLILGGVGSFAYILSTFTQILVEGRLQSLLAKRRLLHMIEGQRNHFIVCGYGRIGSVVVEQIRREGHPVVVIERDEAIVERLRGEGILHIKGDATSDEVLEQAGLYRARSLITALTQEAANVYVTLTARQLAPNLNIIARADNATHIPRLERAGANRVVMPHVIGGLRMAQTVLRPSVTNLLEQSMGGNMELVMEEHRVAPSSELAGKNLIQSNIRPRFNAIIIGIKKPDGQMLFNPGPETVINQDDTLITVGSNEHMVELRKLCTGEIS
ncbi:potassium channel protein [Desulfohalovibrio reitneri]|uniref:potassium channel family protein n=1 Tax=Desulfohalovibrio reitneri TaxID=1307759 RepID=UPI0031346039